MVGGKHNRVDAEAATIGGGFYNEISATGVGATIAGGQYHLAEGPQCSILGGEENHVFLNGISSAISGGGSGDILAEYSSISGGAGHYIEGVYSSVSGAHSVGFYLSSQHSISLGSSASRVSLYFGSLLGGGSHSMNTYYGVIYAGSRNSVSGSNSVIVNGSDSAAKARLSVILGGGVFPDSNTTGDSTNPNIGGASVILGGAGNNTTGNYCSLGGGNGRIQSVDYSYDF